MLNWLGRRVSLQNSTPFRVPAYQELYLLVMNYKIITFSSNIFIKRLGLQHSGMRIMWYFNGLWKIDYFIKCGYLQDMRSTCICVYRHQSIYRLSSTFKIHLALKQRDKFMKWIIKSVTHVMTFTSTITITVILLRTYNYRITKIYEKQFKFNPRHWTQFEILLFCADRTSIIIFFH